MKRALALLILCLVLVAGVTVAQKTRQSKPASAGKGLIGAWLSTDNFETVTIATTEGSIGATFNYKSPDRTVVGKWSDCKMSASILKCKWTGDHDDATKTAQRKGTLKATLKGDVLSVIFQEEDTENMNWKPGYGPHVFDSSIGAGAIRERDYKRKPAD